MHQMLQAQTSRAEAAHEMRFHRLLLTTLSACHQHLCQPVTSNPVTHKLVTHKLVQSLVAAVEGKSRDVGSFADE